jgi:hypothetical protein
MDKRKVIGKNATVDFGRWAVGVPAKVDTGADSSSVWASKIRIGEDGVLRFALFGKGSPYYTGKIFKRTDYKVAIVRSASGHEQIRYRTQFTVRINGRKIRALFNLSDRANNNFPVLIGRRTISGKFLVDVAKGDFDHQYKYGKENRSLNAELKKNPSNFYKKYHGGKSS